MFFQLYNLCLVAVGLATMDFFLVDNQTMPHHKKDIDDRSSCVLPARYSLFSGRNVPRYRGILYQGIILLCSIDDRFTHVLPVIYSLFSGRGPRYRGTLYQGIILLCCNQKENRLDLLQKSSCQDFFLFSVKYFHLQHSNTNYNSLYFFNSQYAVRWLHCKIDQIFILAIDLKWIKGFYFKNLDYFDEVSHGSSLPI